MPRRVWLLIIGMLINVVGSSLLWPINTIYMHEKLGQTLSVAGLVLMGNSAAGILGSFLGGYLFDRFGGYVAILTGIFLSLFTLLGLTIWHGWPHYVYFIIGLGFTGGIVFPSMYAMIGTAWPEGGRKAFNALYLSQNLGVAIGPALAGVIAAYSFDYLFIGNFLMYVVFSLLAVFGYKSFHVRVSTHGKKAKVKIATDKAPLYSLSIIVVAFVICWIVYSQWSTTIAAYTQQLGISLKQYSLLWTINGALIVAAQPLLNPIIRKMEHKIKYQIVLGVVILMISFVVVAFAETFAFFAIAMAILTIGEMFVWPAVPTIASMIAPKGKEGFYQGIVNSAATFGRMFGPFVGGILIDQYDVTVMFLVLTSFLALAIIPSLLYDRPMKKKDIQ